MNPRQNYDIIVAGAGLAGLSFIHYFLKNPDFKNQSVLVLDSDTKNQNDRTWSFWSENRPDYHCAQHKIWTKLSFIGDDFVKTENIAPYKYYTIHGLDFYNEIFAEIGRSDRIEFKKDKILSINDLGEFCELKCESSTFCSKVVIDSITRPSKVKENYIFNYQNFLGWRVNTEKSYFDPETPVLMDFRVPQLNQSSFIYILPYSDKDALVEFTQFTSVQNIDKQLYGRELKKYIVETLGITHFEIREEEKGSIPMTNFPFEPRPSKNIFRIGTAGGDTKSSTGYTFQNVQNHCKEIISEMQGEEILYQDRSRYRFYDDLLLKIIAENPSSVKPIMTDLFKQQPISRILKFLDEDSNLLEDALIFKTLPWMPFIQALLRRKDHVARL